MEHPHFYAVIIGTEILNGRRRDRHFEFVRTALSERGYDLYAALIIKDDPALIQQTFNLVKSDEKAVLFSFGGIGSTPDDLTRHIAASVFTGNPLVRHNRFESDIVDRFGDKAYPHRIQMADLPGGAQLLHNPVNNMSGFFLEQRYFFVPGFPEMAHPMITEALSRFFPKTKEKFRKTLLAQTGENSLIEVMNEVPGHMELSSLPMLKDNIPTVELSLACFDAVELEEWFSRFTDDLDRRCIAYTLLP